MVSEGAPFAAQLQIHSFKTDKTYQKKSCFMFEVDNRLTFCQVTYITGKMFSLLTLDNISGVCELTPTFSVTDGVLWSRVDFD